MTPVAAYDGEIVAIKPNYEGVPSIVFTIPPLTSVGLQEEVAKEQGLHFKTKKADRSSWYSSRRIGEKYSGFKVSIEEGTDRILGAHAEVINIFAIATQLGLRATDIKQDIVAYPSKTSDISYML